MSQRDTTKTTPSRISDEMLDELIGEDDATALFHSGTLFEDLKQRLAERILNAEMTHHLAQDDQLEAGNTRNGHNRKTVLTGSGSMPLEVPRDRLGTFEPQLVEKYCRRLPEFDDKVMKLFARGMTMREMQRALKDIYAIDVSPELIATVTDEVFAECEDWRNRPLASSYAILYLDAIHVKIRDAGVVETRAIYLALGVDHQGYKDVLGMWLGEREGAKFWLTVLNELKHRGVEDVLIAIVDGLKGFPEAFETAFPKTAVQTCVVHLIRYSLACAPHRERKTLAAALKPIYRAASEAQALAELDRFEDSDLGQRYPDVVRSWRSKWALVTPFLTFSEPIRKVLYTTNAIESLNAAVRRTVRSRGHFTSERAAFKLIYMTLREATAKWKGPLACWNAAQREFAIHFGERFEASRGYVTRT